MLDENRETLQLAGIDRALTASFVMFSQPCRDLRDIITLYLFAADCVSCLCARVFNRAYGHTTILVGS